MTPSQERTTPNDDVPRILLRYLGREPATVEFVEYGIEEEGVPWCTRSLGDEPNTEVTSIDIAYRAASNSRLKIGIGIVNDTHTLHHARLPATDPVLSLPVETNSQARTIGANAARLAKRLPLEPVEE